MIGLEGAYMAEYMRTWAVSKATNGSNLGFLVVSGSFVSTAAQLLYFFSLLYVLYVPPNEQ